MQQITANPYFVPANPFLILMYIFTRGKRGMFKNMIDVMKLERANSQTLAITITERYTV